MWSVGPAEYMSSIERGLHLHPREGPVGEWELTHAMQTHLMQMGYSRPETVSTARHGETLVAYPRVARVDMKS